MHALGVRRGGAVRGSVGVGADDVGYNQGNRGHG